MRKSPFKQSANLLKGYLQLCSSSTAILRLTSDNIFLPRFVQLWLSMSTAERLPLSVKLGRSKGKVKKGSKWLPLEGKWMPLPSLRARPLSVAGHGVDLLTWLPMANPATECFFGESLPKAIQSLPQNSIRLAIIEFFFGRSLPVFTDFERYFSSCWGEFDHTLKPIQFESPLIIFNSFTVH